MTLEEAGPEPADFFRWAVASCALFLPLGLVSVIKAASVHPQWEAGEYAMALRSARTARIAAIAAAVIGAAVIVGALVWVLFGNG
ncbi:MAG: CD225/dispanin family protein [Gordonia sp. (in: high G+C Gram-positive bacteria)]|uniref:CD225/dispanin family protein n=1 Tax=Gordonia sp. (in: high G+C Gram-positive bacteria) TaxID=84139 RepID=UPI0039E566B4